MAKIGEGDTRWIVQTRDDGKNVNNWHWSETDCLAWSKKRITALLSNISFLDDPAHGYCKTTTVQSVTGECTANNRKGKTIFFYELEVKLPWEGKLNGVDVTVKGMINVPYLSEEQDDDKMEVNVSCDDSGPAHTRLLSLVKSNGIPIVQQKVAEFLNDLREEFSVKRAQAPPETSPKPVKETPSNPTTTPTTSSTSTSSSSQSISTKTIKLKEEFRAPPMEVYNAMINPQMLNAITQGSATMDPKEGGAFSLFAGTVTGTNIKLVPGSKIVQKWRFNTWPEGHFSNVNIELTEKEGKTILRLTQEGVPSDEGERTEEGWKRNIWGRAKMMFGFGPSTFI